MEVIDTYIKDLVVFQPKVFKDDRGYFMESFKEEFIKTYLKDIHFIQDNESKSEFGVLRGLHFQSKPFAQSKLVRVVHGKVQDVVVDLRKGSSTFGKYFSIILCSENKNQLFVPKEFAHGFLVLSDYAIVQYKVDNEYNKESERLIRFDDKDIAINWRLKGNQIKLSLKDSENQTLKNYIENEK